MSDNCKVMFFGRLECRNSQEIAQHLKKNLTMLLPIFSKIVLTDFLLN